ncbi:MAG: hypothetical protein KTR32_13600, partial [Granulosicoccus sp.]|nr:hypothetical protein [Granulosicoccus sp.]
MFARISTYKMKQDLIAEAETKLEAMMPQIMAMAGLKSFTNVIDEQGNGVVVSVLESEEVSNASQEQVGQIWAAFSEYMEVPPSVNGYRVLA